MHTSIKSGAHPKSNPNLEEESIVAVVSDPNHAIDMSSFDVNDLTGADVTYTDNQAVAVGEQYTYTFTGSGFGTGTGLPSSGTITGVEITGADGTDLTITDTDVDVASLGFAILFGADFSSIEATILNSDDTFNGSSHSDVLFGFDGNDTFNLGAGGNDTVDGGAGDDIFNMGAKFGANDKLTGNLGNDTVVLNGDYSAGLTLKAGTLTDIETIKLRAGNDYKLTSNDGNVFGGATLTINGSALGAHDKLTFNGSAENEGSLNLTGGKAGDILIAGGGKDTLKGGAGADTLTGGAGGDHFVYTAVSQSNGIHFDTITDAGFKHDKFDLDVVVKAIDAGVTGTLNANNVDASLTDVAGSLHAHHAMVVTDHGGALDGHQFLVVDANGVAGYQSGADYVFDITGATHLAALTKADFI
jgi:Ca2+-binding RTX toxin-like protein